MFDTSSSHKLDLPALRKEIAEKLTRDRTAAAKRARFLQPLIADEMDDVLAGPSREQRDLNAQEARRFRALADLAKEFDDLVDEDEGRIAALRSSLPVDTTWTGRGVPVGGAHVRRDESIYRPDRPETSFFADLVRSGRYQDPRATERLSRHDSEARTAVEFRDIGTSAVSGFVPPQYLLEQYAALARAGRPFLDVCPTLPLPNDGMSVEISRITTGTAVAAQATQNAAISEVDADDTLLSVPVVTVAGQQDVSFQALDRGGFIDQVLFGDLVGAYHTELDRQALNGSGASGEHRGVLNVAGTTTTTYTDATPTFGEIYPKLADAANSVQTARFAGPSVIVMHPRRWNWMLCARDADGRPLITSTPGGNAPFNAAGLATEVGYGKPVGFLFGLPVLTDASIPTNLGAGTNEDRIIVCSVGDFLLFEDPGRAPIQARFDAPGAGNLTGKLVVFGYSAFTAGRYPAGTSIISGTGLITPTFT